MLSGEYVLDYLLDTAGLSRSTYYYHVKRGWQDRHARLRRLIMFIYEKSRKTYGYRKITCELRRRGHNVNHKLVQKLMREMGLRSICKKKWRNEKPGYEYPASPNILARNFTAEAPFKVMTTDVTEIKWRIHKLFLSPLMDFHDNSIVAFSISTNENTELVMRMMEKAKIAIGDMSGSMIHSDQGTLYRTFLYRKFLRENDIVQSMSRRGNCYDNSPMENFFGCMKDEIIRDKEYKSLKDLIRAIKDWIEYYNNDRILLKLGGMSPVQARINSY